MINNIRKRSKVKKKKQEELANKVELSPQEIAVNFALQELNQKLYGLIVPKSGNFLPDFFDMLKLMTLKL